MKKLCFFVGAIALMSFSGSSDNIGGNCCSSYAIIDGDEVPVVTVCGGDSGNDVVDFIENCIDAEDIRDILVQHIAGQ